MYDRRKYAFNGVCYFKNVREIMERDDFFPHIPIGRVGGIDGWSVRLQRENINNITYYKLAIRTDRDRPTIESRVYFGILKPNGETERPVEGNLELRDTCGIAGPKISVDEWLNEGNRYLTNGGIKIEYGFQIKKILSMEGQWTFNFYDKIYDYALSGRAFFENARERIRPDDFPRGRIPSIGGMNDWVVGIHGQFSGDRIYYYPCLTSNEVIPEVLCRYYLSYIKNDGSPDFLEESYTRLEMDASPVGRGATAAVLLDEQEGYLKNGGLTVEFGFQIEGILDSDGIWTFNFHDRLFDWINKLNMITFLRRERDTFEGIAEELKKVKIETMAGEMMKKCVMFFMET
uniref:FBA domain-containing protein n=1 Tax=Caenorhabditis tropicalis TaxID=1561998 RepID=A0A1I7TB26_9PELO